jgi:hypothetical protein
MTPKMSVRFTGVRRWYWAMMLCFIAGWILGGAVEFWQLSILVGSVFFAACLLIVAYVALRLDR